MSISSHGSEPGGGMKRPYRKLSLKLRVLGEELFVEASVPSNSCRLDEALPLLRSIDDHVIERVARRAELQEQTISCRKGCAACCMAQPVPVTPIEAFALWKFVESMPEPKRSEVRQRFSDRVQRLRESGLLGKFLDRDDSLSREEARRMAHDYMRLRIACPFLENNACSIYADRPFVCRQYLVTTPAALCRDPMSNGVKPLSMPMAPAHAVLNVTQRRFGRRQYTIPLVLALEYAERHRAELERVYDARGVCEELIKELAAG